jgi:hypothetical protein
MRKQFFFIVVSIAACGHALGQQDFSKVEIKTTAVAGRSMLEGRGGTSASPWGPTAS